MFRPETRSPTWAPRSLTVPTRFSEVTRYKGSVVNVVLEGGRFWPMQPGRAEVTTITVK